jgi:ABC-type polysaccharide/polyol phosphate transport system ATPase subunit
MSRRPIISVAGVTKSFRMKGAQASTLKAAFSEFLRRRPTPPYLALRGVSFDVFEGETVGIIGSNGSGKSTVLKLITGIIRPSEGTVKVHGRISPLIELGAGFQPDFSGRENIFLNGAMLGVPRKVIESRFDDIVAFADIARFIDQPVKTYSSGMYTRLAFSIAIHVDPDILVVDEVLAVGDEAFQQKCLARVRQLREAGKTILLVAHNQATIAAMCDRVIWLEKGVMRLDGAPHDVLAAYAGAVAAPSAPSVQVESVAMVGPAGNPLEAVRGGERVSVDFAWRATAGATLNWTLTVFRANDTLAIVGAQGPRFEVAAGETGSGAFVTDWPHLATGDYELVVGAERDGVPVPCSGHRRRFHVEAAWSGPALCGVAGEWTSTPRPAAADVGHSAARASGPPGT